jgi:hypothetical protein
MGGEMVPQWIGPSSCTILFDHLYVTWNEAQLRRYFVWLMAALLIVFWSIPIGFTGALSQLDLLLSMVSHPNPLRRWPPWVVGTLQGLLPQLALAVLMLVFPGILKLVIRQQKLPRCSWRSSICRSFTSPSSSPI